MKCSKWMVTGFCAATLLSARSGGQANGDVAAIDWQSTVLKQRMLAQGWYQHINVEAPREEPAHAGLLFLDRSRLFAYAIIDQSERNPPPANWEALQKLPYALEGVVLDARTGTAGQTVKIPAPLDSNELVAAGGGLAVCLHPRNLRDFHAELFSPDFSQQHPLNVGVPTGPLHIRASETGESIGIERFDLLNPYDAYHDLVIFDPTTLAQKTILTGALGPIAISDSGIAAFRQVRDTYEELQINYRPNLSPQWKVLPNPIPLEHYGQGGHGGSPIGFLDETTLVWGRTGFYAVTTDGETLMRFPLAAQNFLTARLSVASAARICAIGVETIKIHTHLPFGEDTQETVGMQVDIFDIGRRALMLSLPANPVPRHNFDFALSPDAAELAVLNDGVITMYRLEAGRAAMER